jgi:hypothetical protein
MAVIASAMKTPTARKAVATGSSAEVAFRHERA